MQEIINFRVRPRFPETLKAWTPVPTAAFAPYVDLYKMEYRLSFLTVDEQLDEMDRHGIAVAVLSGGNRHENRFIAELCARHPDRFVGLGGVQPQEGATKAYRDAREALARGRRPRRRPASPPAGSGTPAPTPPRRGRGDGRRPVPPEPVSGRPLPGSPAKNGRDDSAWR